jgi:hypothetical protein
MAMHAGQTATMESMEKSQVHCSPPLDHAALFAAFVSKRLLNHLTSTNNLTFHYGQLL